MNNFLEAANYVAGAIDGSITVFDLISFSFHKDFEKGTSCGNGGAGAGAPVTQGDAAAEQENALIGEGKRPMPTMGTIDPTAAGMNQSGGALSDAALAEGFKQQAESFTAQAEGMLAEARSLMAQAAELSPAKPKAKRATKAKAKAPTKARKTSKSK